MSDKTKFKVHYTDGTKIVVEAENPVQARKEALTQKSGHVSKIKILRDSSE